jgi:hypothetical protein
MNVFVLSTGRCGSTTFSKACSHITNYTSGHETRSARLGADRLAYPDNHIEADNRLSWFLGKLDHSYGDRAFYVHLCRNEHATARSFVRRYDRPQGIIHAYRQAILLRGSVDNDPLEVCVDYCSTVNANIDAFLRNKSRSMRFSVENAADDFRRFWSLIGAEGDLEVALKDWSVPYNASPTDVGRPVVGPRGAARAARKLQRIIRTLPAYLRDA